MNRKKHRKSRFILLYNREEDRYEAFFAEDTPIEEWGELMGCETLSEHLVAFEKKNASQLAKALRAMGNLGSALCPDYELHEVLEAIFMTGFRAGRAHGRKEGKVSKRA